MTHLSRLLPLSLAFPHQSLVALLPLADYMLLLEFLGVILTSVSGLQPRASNGPRVFSTLMSHGHLKLILVMRLPAVPLPSEHFTWITSIYPLGFPFIPTECLICA